MYLSITAIGNLGRDPEMRYLPNGTAVTNFNMAVNRQWKDKEGETVKETIWLRVSVFGKQAEAVNQYKTKGDLVLVKCRLNPDPETGGPKIYTRNDGSPGANFEVIASKVLFLPKSGGGNGGDVAASGYTGPETNDPVDEDEIPF